MKILGIILVVTITVIILRVILLGKYDNQNNNLLRNIKKFDDNPKKN